MKMLGEVTDDADVGFCGTMRVITALEFLQHFFAKLGHRDLLFCDPTYLNSLAFTPPDWLLLAHAKASAAPAASFKSLLHKSSMAEMVRKIRKPPSSPPKAARLHHQNAAIPLKPAEAGR